jgi:hypothetical protein
VHIEKADGTISSMAGRFNGSTASAPFDRVDLVVQARLAGPGSCTKRCEKVYAAMPSSNLNLGGPQRKLGQIGTHSTRRNDHGIPRRSFISARTRSAEEVNVEHLSKRWGWAEFAVAPRRWLHSRCGPCDSPSLTSWRPDPVRIALPDAAQCKSPSQSR